MSSLKRGKKPKKSRRFRKVRRGYSPPPVVDPPIELPYESRSPSPVALRNRKRRGRSESPEFHQDDKRWAYDDPQDRFFYDDGTVHGFRVVPSNFFYKKKEVMHKSFNIDIIDVSPFDVLNAIQRRVLVHPSICQVLGGDDQSERDGNSIEIIRIAWKFTLETVYENFLKLLIPPPVGMFDFETVCNIRFCVIRDRFCRGVDPASILDAEIWDSTSSQRLVRAFRNISSLKRFEILYDKIHTVEWKPPVTYGEGVSPGPAAGVAWLPRWRSVPVEVYIEKPIDVFYSSSLSTIGAIDQNNIFVVAYPGNFERHVIGRFQACYISNTDVRISFVNK